MAPLPSSSPSSPAASTTSAGATPQPAPPVSGPVPGVIDCAQSFDKLYVRPAFVLLACGDGGFGLRKLTWTRWVASGAIGQGEFFDNLCQPSCAAGKEGIYPVQVTLSGVKSSSLGPYFSQLQVTWEGSRPPNMSQNSFDLMAPGES